MGDQDQLRLQRQDQINAQHDDTLSETQSRTDWKLKVDGLFAGFGFARHEEMPEQEAEATLKENTQLVAGRNIGTMEMVKARREYRRKRDTAVSRRAILEDYNEKLNREEAVFASRTDFESRDAWNMVHLLPAEKHQDFLEACNGTDKVRKRAALEEIIFRIRTADLSIFTYRTDDDFYENYETKMRLIQAGFVARNALNEYINLGGTMDERQYQELLARIDFLEEQQLVYDQKDKILLHPQSMLLRDKDMDAMTMDQVNERMVAVQREIGRLRNQTDPATARRAERLQNLQSYLMNLATEKFRMESSQAKDHLKPGEDPGQFLDRLRQRRKEKNRRQWVTNLKGLLTRVVEQDERKVAVMQGLQAEVGQDDVWHGAGITGRVPTQYSVVALTYMHRYGKTLEDLEKPENIEELKRVRDEVFAALQTSAMQKQEGETDEDLHKRQIISVAGVMTEMIRGLVAQFAVVGDRANYMQINGVGDMSSAKFGEEVRDWDKPAANLYLLGVMAKDIAQLGETNPEVAQLALSSLSKEELRQYREIAFFAEDAGGLMQNMVRLLTDNMDLRTPDAVTEESIADLVDGEETVTEESTDARGRVIRQKKMNLMGNTFQGYVRYLRGLQGEQSENLTRSLNTVQQGEQNVRAPLPWQMETGMGIISITIQPLMISSARREDAYAQMRPGGAIHTTCQREKDDALRGNHMDFGKTVSVPVNDEGRVPLPEGF
ncbi:MAG: hypothetical protein IJT34_01100 [Butyrivibrio sp.]|nr:hypothetical protein [Butyrivibrio sp.]